MRNLTTSVVSKVILIILAALWTSGDVCAQDKGEQLPHDTDISPATRAKIILSPPAEERIEVPKKYRGVQVMRDMEGTEIKLDFAASYRAGYVVGWRNVLEAFQRGSLDLDEAEGDNVAPPSPPPPPPPPPPASCPPPARSTAHWPCALPEE